MEKNLNAQVLSTPPVIGEAFLVLLFRAKFFSGPTGPTGKSLS
jgi:hypothetical protein